jgi:hypothetical protein
MVMGISSILESPTDVEISNKVLKVMPTDARAKHIKTSRELELFKFSSNYQTFGDGMSNLETETGVNCRGSDQACESFY